MKKLCSFWPPVVTIFHSILNAGRKGHVSFCNFLHVIEEDELTLAETDNYLEVNMLQILEIAVNSIFNVWIENIFVFFLKVAFKKWFCGSFITSCCTCALLGLEINSSPSKPSWAFSYFCHPSRNKVSANDKNMANFMSWQNWADDSVMPKDEKKFRLASS